MVERRPKVIKPIPTPVQPMVEALAERSVTATFELSGSKRGLRVYGENKLKPVLREVEEQITQIPGRLGLSDAELEQLRDGVRSLDSLNPAISEAARILKVLLDTKQGTLHTINATLECLARALNDKPAYGDRFPRLVEHVCGAAIKGHRTRRAKGKGEGESPGG